MSINQPDFDYITIDPDTDTDEENEFKDKFSVVAATHILDCNICLQTYYNNFIFFKCKTCSFQLCPRCFNSFYFVYNYKTCPICKN